MDDEAQAAEVEDDDTALALPSTASEPDGTRPTEGVQGVVQVLVKVARALSCPNSEPDGTRPDEDGPDAALVTTNEGEERVVQVVRCVPEGAGEVKGAWRANA